MIQGYFEIFQRCAFPRSHLVSICIAIYKTCVYFNVLALNILIENRQKLCKVRVHVSKGGHVKMCSFAGDYRYGCLSQ